MTGRRVAFGLLVLVLVAGVLLAGPGGSAPLGSSRGPEGTLALRRFLAAMGVDVVDGPEPGSTDESFVILVDLRSPDEAEQILEWVERGGRLIVADPASVIPGAVGIASGATVGGGVIRHTLTPGCAAAETVGVREIALLPSDVLLEHPPWAEACFASAGLAFHLSVRHGAGEIVALGGRSPFTNEFLRRADNALYAARLFGARSRVIFGEPLPPGAAPGRSGGVWAALPTAARIVIVHLILAGILFMVARARRLGRPIDEKLLAPIPAGELVRAGGRLYRAARATGFAGELLRRGALDRLARRTGLQPGSAPERITATLGASASLSPADVADRLTGPAPADDRELTELAARLDELVQRIERERV